MLLLKREGQREVRSIEDRLQTPEDEWSSKTDVAVECRPNYAQNIHVKMCVNVDTNFPSVCVFSSSPVTE